MEKLIYNQKLINFKDSEVNSEDPYINFTTKMVDTSNVEMYGTNYVISENALINFKEKSNGKRIKLLKDHSQNIDSIIGFVDNVTYSDNDKALFADCHILNIDQHKDLKLKIKEGLLDSVSVGFSFSESDYDKKTKTQTIQDINIIELSLVTFPAIENAKISEINFNKKIEERLDMTDKNMESTIEFSKKVDDMKQEFSKEVDSLKQEFSKQIENVKNTVEEQFSKKEENMQINLNHYKETNVSQEEKEAFLNYAIEVAIKSKKEIRGEPLDLLLNESKEEISKNTPKKFNSAKNNFLNYTGFDDQRSLSEMITSHDQNGTLGEHAIKFVDVSQQMNTSVYEDKTASVILNSVNSFSDSLTNRMTEYYFDMLEAVARPVGEAEQNTTFRGDMNRKRVSIAKQGIYFAHTFEATAIGKLNIQRYISASRKSFNRGIVTQLVNKSTNNDINQIASLFGDNQGMVDITIPQKNVLSAQKITKILMEQGVSYHEGVIDWTLMCDRLTFLAIQKASYEEAKTEGDLLYTNSYSVQPAQILDKDSGVIFWGGLNWVITDNTFVNKINPNVSHGSPYEIYAESVNALPRGVSSDVLPDGFFMLAYRGRKNSQYNLAVGNIRAYVTKDFTRDNIARFDFFQNMAGSYLDTRYVLRFMNPSTMVTNTTSKTNKENKSSMVNDSSTKTNEEGK